MRESARETPTAARANFKCSGDELCSISSFLVVDNFLSLLLMHFVVAKVEEENFLAFEKEDLSFNGTDACVCDKAMVFMMMMMMN